MSKIVKKRDLDVLIESNLKKAGIKKEVVTESTEKKIVEKPVKKEVVAESTEKKTILNEDFKNELAKFNKLTNYKY